MKSNNKFVVLRISGKQYKVSENQEFLVDLLGDTKDINAEVLLFADGDKVEVGTPVLTNTKVTLKVVSDLEKGEKVVAFKYKSKSRYRKTIGFRPKHTRLLLEKITSK